MSGVDQAMAPFTEMASQFLKMEKDGGAVFEKNPADQLMKEASSDKEEMKQSEMMSVKAAAVSTTSDAAQEEKKGEDVSSLKSLNMDDIINKGSERVNQLPWSEHLANPASNLHKAFFADVENQFTKRFTLFF